MKSSLYDALQNIIKQGNYIRFHMPGHKGRSKTVIDWNKYDFTEIPGSDNLSNPYGVLLNIMNDIANIYEVKKSLLLVNGSTVGIIASILTTCKPGESFVVPRNSHRSVYSALLLHDIDPIYIYPITGKTCSYPIIKPHQVERVFKENPNCKGIIITSPTYHGVCSDIKTIGEISKKYNKVLIVDEAHGAHLKFHKDFPLSSVDLGADIVIQSTHKTLGSFNQGALLHVCSEQVNILELKNTLNMLQTSSPSYPIMISIENAIKDAHINRTKLGELIDYYEYTQRKLNDTNYSLEGTELLKSGQIFGYDKSKLWITTHKISGHKLSEYLRDKYNIQIEMWDNHSILAMMGIGTTQQDVKRLIAALKDISNTHGCSDKIYLPEVYSYPVVESMMTPQQTCKELKEVILLSKSKGRVSAEFIIPYPPGIPALVPGEIIDDHMINFIHNWQAKDVQGLTKDGGISVISKRR